MGWRFATGPQLWRLNAAGRLAVVDAGEPIKADVAFELVSELEAAAAADDGLEPAA